MESIRYKQMKTFITCAEEYGRHRTENGKTTLLQQLQFLGATADMTVFDPGSAITSQFYMRLYELMKSLEAHNSLTWAAVACLRQACHNPAARDALTHTYKFNQILARFLSPLPVHEKLVQLLNLLEDLSYGIRFTWQEAHLPSLMKALASLITGEDGRYITPALTIMINLCYKNLPAVYALMRSVDQTQFLESIKKLAEQDTYIHVQVFKLLFTLEYVSGELHDEDILSFVEEIFLVLGDAFSVGNVVLMKQIVDFFRDVQSNEHIRKQVLSYDKFLQNTHNLMSLLDTNSQDPQSVGVLFQFIHSLVTLKVSNLSELYPRLVHLALSYIHTKVASYGALSLIHEIVADESVHDDVKEKVVSALNGRLEIILLSLDSRGDADNRCRLSALMNLLTTACKNDLIRGRVLSIIDPEAAHSLFFPLLNENIQEVNENIFDVNYSKFYVYMLDFISVLTTNSDFQCLYEMLLMQKKVHMILALALYLGTEDIKRRVLSMTRTEVFPEVSLKSLANTLCDLEPLLLQHPSVRHRRNTEPKSQESAPLFGPSQEVRLNELIKETNQVVVNAKNGDSLVTSYLMKLYEYKLASVSHSERQLEAHLETATSHSTKLQHQLAQVSAEASRLQRELYHAQQCMDAAVVQKQDSDLKYTEAKFALEVAQQRNQQNVLKNESEVKTIQLTVDELKSALEVKTSQLNVAVDEAKTKGKEVVERRALNQQQEQEILDLHGAVNNLEQHINELEKRLHSKETEIFLTMTERQALELKNKRLEQLLLEKDKKLGMVQTQFDVKKRQLNELERIRNVIFEISTPTEKKILQENADL